MARRGAYESGENGLFLMPMVTMRSYAEEKRSGTIELLLTSPLRDVKQG